MSRDPLNRETYTSDGLDADDFDNLDAVNDDQYAKSKPSKADTLRARRGGSMARRATPAACHQRRLG